MAIIIKNYDQKSSTVLNAIKTGASAEYQARIDDATQDNLALVQSQIYAYESTRNELYNAIDKIVITDIDNMYFENDFKRLKKASLSYGKDKETLWVNLIKAQNYDVNTAPEELFKRHKPEILSVYHTVNRTNVYPITIDYEIITRMFMSEQGFGEMMATLMSVQETSDEVDEFLLFKGLINANYIEGKIDTVVVAPVIDKQSANDLVVAIKNQSNIWKYPRTTYNYANVVQTCPKARQVLILNTNYKAIIDVEVLAVAFNEEKVAFDTVQIETDDFGSDSGDTIAMLVDERWFEVRDKLREVREVENPLGLYRNKFYHVHQLYGALPFYNANMFSQATPTLTAIDVVPATATIATGQGRAFTVETTGTNNPSAKSVWTHDGTSENTYVTTTGFLFIGVDETTTPITLTATSEFNGVTDTAVITVV